MKAFITTLFICLAASLSAQKTLPVIYLDGTFNSDKYEVGKLTVVNSDQSKTEYRIKAHYRGSASKKYDKKSFAIKFQDENGVKLDVSLFGLRSDNRWILDAMACDASRMRNRVSFDLWNEFSHPSYVAEYEETAMNGVNGTFVELYFNGNYNGIYCLNEKVDRKQMQLKDVSNKGKIRGGLYKAEEWGTTQFWEELAAYDNQSKTCEGWESEYPDVEDDGSANWKPLADAIEFIALADKSKFLKEVEQRVDLPVWNDYLIFMLVAGLTDNGGKNTYTYFYDSTSDDLRLGICPWDMDSSWGRLWEGSKVGAKYNRGTSNMLYTKLFMWQDGYYDTLKERYASLRNSSFSIEHLKSLFTKYFDLYEETGAGKREVEQWNNNPASLDFSGEKKYIFDWIEQRIAFTDSFFGFSPSGISSVLYDEQRNELKDAYFTIDGRKVTEPQPGKIYIHNGKKVHF